MLLAASYANRNPGLLVGLLPTLSHNQILRSSRESVCVMPTLDPDNDIPGSSTVPIRRGFYPFQLLITKQDTLKYCNGYETRSRTLHEPSSLQDESASAVSFPRFRGRYARSAVVSAPTYVRAADPTFLHPFPPILSSVPCTWCGFYRTSQIALRQQRIRPGSFGQTARLDLSLTRQA